MAAPAENSEVVVPSVGLAAPVKGAALELLRAMALVRSEPALAAVAQMPVPVAMLPTLLGAVPSPREMAETAAAALRWSTSPELELAASTRVPARPSRAEPEPVPRLLSTGSVPVVPARVA
jgi:hypothetical protein